MSEQERTSQTCLSGPQAGRPSVTAERAQGVQSQGQAEPLRTSEAGSSGSHRWGPRPSPRPSQTSSCGLPSVVPALDTSRHVLVQETAEAGHPPHLLHHLPSQPGHLGAEMKSRSPRESPQGHTNWAARAGVYFQHPGQPPPNSDSGTGALATRNCHPLAGVPKWGQSTPQHRRCSNSPEALADWAPQEGFSEPEPTTL